MMRPNREMLKTVAQALGDLCNQLVFVGGATVDLYATNPGASAVRATLDVDCVIEIASRTGFYELEEALRKKGFVNDQSEGAPLCRWIYQDIKVDVMPTQSEVLGFTNEWYEEGIRHTFRYSLNDGVVINLLETPYFIATKLKALDNRGMADLRLSKDLEDIVYVLRNRSSLVTEIRLADEKVKKYITAFFRELLSMNIVDEAVAAVLDFGEPTGTQQMVRSIMQEIGSIDNS
jgi:predicted nucleotidyltransferase